jgi:hypothetical protein
MTRKGTSKKRPETKSQQSNPFDLRKETKPDSEVHVFGNGIVCDTEKRGFATPDNLDPLRLVLNSPGGIIPLWARSTTLQWRFRERSLRVFQNPAAVKAEVRKLFGEALLAWGDAAPVKFTEDPDVWDFEIVLRKADDCDANGCVLAAAFFPDTGRHALEIYPRMFTQDRVEQVETLIHETGHIFGLRHFFAQVLEVGAPSDIFGTHSRFSIMNYGPDSRLTQADRSDLRRLYQQAWSGQLTHINGTPIRFVQPFHTITGPQNHIVAVNPVQAAPQPQPSPGFVYEP